MSQLSHLDAQGAARMVDVADRAVSVRTARASGVVRTTAAAAIATGTVPKGDVLAVARVAGIMAAKRTWELIPMCHPIALHQVVVELRVDGDEVRIEAAVRTADRTGVEMEALTAVSVAALTIVDMTKSLDPGAVVADIRVDEKTGGRSGEWHR